VLAYLTMLCHQSESNQKLQVDLGSMRYLLSTKQDEISGYHGDEYEDSHLYTMQEFTRRNCGKHKKISVWIADLRAGISTRIRKRSNLYNIATFGKVSWQTLKHC
jgi:hypothetical protein